MASTLTVSRNITQLVHVCAQHKKTLGPGICGLTWSGSEGFEGKFGSPWGQHLSIVWKCGKKKNTTGGCQLFGGLQNLQDRFHILAYRDLSCHCLGHYLNRSCAFLILASLLERNKKLVRFMDKIRQKVWCPAWPGRFDRVHCGFNNGIWFWQEQSRKEKCMIASRSLTFSKLLIDQRVCWSSIPWEKEVKGKGSL